jgi:putative MATE family efflux protein
MKDLTQGNEAGTLIRFALPMLAGSVFQQFYNMVDSFVVGRFVGKQALAAVGQSFPVIFVSIALITGITLAGNVLASRFFGARENGRVQDVIDTTLWITKQFSLLMTVLGFLAAPLILDLMRTPPDVMGGATLYLRIVFLGSYVNFMYSAIASVMRALGDSKTPLVALIASTLVNVALDLLFVVAFRWGIAGVAVATVIAQGVSVVWTLGRVRRTCPEFAIRLFRPRLSREIAESVARIGLPSGAQQAMVGAGFMTVTGIVNGFGTDPAAAFSAAGKLDNFAMLPALNMGLAISTFTGQNLGAGRKDRVRKGLLWGSLTAAGVSASIALAMYLAGDAFLRAFTTDAEVVRIGFEYLRIVSLGYVVQTLMFCVSGVIRGAGATVFTMFMTLTAMWLVRVPCALALSRFRGTSGIWWAIVIGYSVGLAGTLLYYFFGPWEKGGSSAASISV